MTVMVRTACRGAGHGGGSSFPTSSADWQSATGTTGTTADVGGSRQSDDGGSRQSATGTTGTTTMGTNFDVGGSRPKFDDGGSRPSNDDEARPKDGAYVDACDQTHGGVPAWHEEVALLHSD